MRDSREYVVCELSRNGRNFFLLIYPHECAPVCAHEEQQPQRRNMGEITVCAEADKWILKITPNGFVFNREKYPLGEPRDFAEAFLKILEQEYEVTFEKRKNFPQKCLKEKNEQNLDTN